jgi:hypothetical protein
LLITNAIDLAKLGGNSKYAIDHLGNENANTLTGTSRDEIFVAGAGDDTLWSPAASPLIIKP